jgi:hypothetical protein
VKIYWLRIDDEKFFFCTDQAESDDEENGGESDVPAHAGQRGWFERQVHKFKSAWQHADHGVLHWIRLVWDWLHSLTRPDEAMLSRLRPARRIDLHHPAACRDDEVRGAWRDYLTRQWWRHLLWLSVNGVIAPLSVALAVLPGPNVIGFWFAYRVIHHSLVVWGIGRVLRDEIPVELHSLAELDSPIHHDELGEASHAALDAKAAQLDDHVKWWRRRGRSMTSGRGRPTVSASASTPEASQNCPDQRSDG